MKIKLLLLAIVIATTAQAQSTDGKKLDKCVNTTIKGLKKLDTADVATFRALMISDDEILDFIDAMDVADEFKEEIRANVNDGMFQNAMQGSFKDFVRITGNMDINWKQVVYEDFIYEMRKRDGLKQLRGELYFVEGEKHMQLQMTAALLNGKYVVIELEDLRGVRVRNDEDEIAREVREAMEEAAEEAVEEYEYENREQAPVPPPVVIEYQEFSDENRPMRAEIIDFPDVEAEFPGGIKAMQQYIIDNVKYPVEAIEKGVQGKVYLSFVVEIDGSLTDVKVERGVSPELNNEAKRLVSGMPNWSPGEAGGKKMRTRCRLPIIFELQEDVEE